MAARPITSGEPPLPREADRHYVVGEAPLRLREAAAALSTRPATRRVRRPAGRVGRSPRTATRPSPRPRGPTRAPLSGPDRRQLEERSPAPDEPSTTNAPAAHRGLRQAGSAAAPARTPQAAQVRRRRSGPRTCDGGYLCAPTTAPARQDIALGCEQLLQGRRGSARHGPGHRPGPSTTAGRVPPTSSVLARPPAHPRRRDHLRQRWPRIRHQARPPSPSAPSPARPRPHRAADHQAQPTCSPAQDRPAPGIYSSPRGSRRASCWKIRFRNRFCDCIRSPSTAPPAPKITAGPSPVIIKHQAHTVLAAGVADARGPGRNPTLSSLRGHDQEAQPDLGPTRNYQPTGGSTRPETRNTVTALWGHGLLDAQRPQACRRLNPRPGC